MLKLGCSVVIGAIVGLLAGFMLLVVGSLLLNELLA
jgi:hypothetical protein